VRPAGRSLSVHHGKGATHAAARIGALCEAFEAHCAELVPADGPVCAFAALPEAERAPEPGDYCRQRAGGPNLPDEIQWCGATDLLSGGRCWLPHDLVSLDFTRGLPSPFERASSGLGAGASEGDALLISLLEVIERDAAGAWDRLDAAARMARAIASRSVPFAWFQSWRDRLAALGVTLQIFALESVIFIPAYKIVIGGSEEFGSAWRRFSGTAAHGDPEIALFKSLAEAIQSRLTLIAGVRDDILPAYYARPRPRPAAGQGAGGGGAWTEATPQALSAETIAGRLADRGYRQVAFRRLDAGLDGIAVTKAFVPGLGSSRRTRRESA
jgi:ribosomal protein S12 methylthiotransferase accessory factor